MRRISAVVLFGLLLLAGSQPGYAAIIDVLAGSDYLVTQPGTVFNGVPFIGVPSGPGGSDTIVTRLQTVDVTGGSGTTALLLSMLQLQSAVPTDFGLGVGFYYITLQSARGGTSSTGSMTITQSSPDDNTPANPEGSFTSLLDVFFDVRFGSLNGPIALSTDLILTNGGTLWDANPAPNDFLVTGPRGDFTANDHTGKIRDSDIYDMDFFPVGVLTESSGSDTHAVTTTTFAPEPGTLLLTIIGGLLVLVGRRGRAA
jgi:hypothetical protein